MSEIIIDRSVKAVRVEVRQVIDACWLGHKFATQYRDLVDQGWNIVCHEPCDLPSPLGAEKHTLGSLVGLPYETTTSWADAIAWWINHPPSHSGCPRGCCARGGR